MVAEILRVKHLATPNYHGNAVITTMGLWGK